MKTVEAPKITQKQAFEDGVRDASNGTDTRGYYERNYDAGIQLAYMDGLQGFKFHKRSSGGFTNRK
jgi:hypothetical protein